MNNLNIQIFLNKKFIFNNLNIKIFLNKKFDKYLLVALRRKIWNFAQNRFFIMILQSKINCFIYFHHFSKKLTSHRPYFKSWPLVVLHSKVLSIFYDIKCKQNLKVFQACSIERKSLNICQTYHIFLKKSQILSTDAGLPRSQYPLLQYLQRSVNRQPGFRPDG